MRLTVAGLALVLLTLTACSPAVPPAAAPAATSVSTSPVTSSPPSTSTAPDATSAAGAAEPVVVPVRIYSHCGIRRVQVHGQWWEAITPAPEPSPRESPDGTFLMDGHTLGTMTILSADRARFDVDPADATPIPGGVEFRPETGDRPGPCA